MKRLVTCAVGLFGVLLCGCAQYPADLTAGGPQLLIDLRLTVRGAIDNNAYYLFVIDTNGNSTNGPEVIAPLTQYLGNGRATGSYTHYVEYHQNQFELFQDQPEMEGQTVPPRQALGQPFYYDSTSSSGTLNCTLAMSQLKTSANDPDFTELEINLITVNEIVLPGEIPVIPRQTDGIGALGNNFLAVRIENGLIIRNDGLESTGEVIDGQQLDPAYDLSDFRVEIRRGS